MVYREPAYILQFRTATSKRDPLSKASRVTLCTGPACDRCCSVTYSDRHPPEVPPVMPVQAAIQSRRCHCGNSNTLDSAFAGMTVGNRLPQDMPLQIAIGAV